MSFGLHSAVEPFGPQAERIARLWWLMLAVSAVVFVLVASFCLAAALRSGPRRERAAQRGGAERRVGRVVAGSAVATAAVIVALLLADLFTGRALARLAPDPTLSIDVVGHQWWWEVRYPDAVPSQTVTTANEIHIPVGRNVQVQLLSRDVIHSFWVPNLHGKRDLIPGHGSRITLRADEPGVFRGLCAEFCGVQHANMSFVLVAEPEDAFQSWLAAQRRPAPPPRDEEQARGKDVFLATTCALCHNVGGTGAWGQNGPDLTHVGSRRWLAAGTIANTPENLSRWISDPHHLKPGTKMPPTLLEAADLQALVAYVDSLK